MAVKMNPKENIVQAFTSGSKLGEGALGGLLNLPGINAIGQTVQGLIGPQPFKNVVTAAGSRFTPSFGLQLQKTNPLEHLFFGASGVQTTQEYKAANDAKAKKAAATRAAKAKGL